MIKLSDIAYIETLKSIKQYSRNCDLLMSRQIVFVPKNFSVSFRGIKVVDSSYINKGLEGFYLIDKTDYPMSCYCIAFILNSILGVYGLLYDAEKLVFKKVSKKRLQSIVLKEIKQEYEPSIAYLEQVIESSLVKEQNELTGYDVTMYNIWTDLMDAISLEIYALDSFDIGGTSVLKAWADLYEGMMSHDNPLEDIEISLLSPNSDVMNRKKRLHVTMSRIGELLK